MSYEAVLSQVRAAPEECLDAISDYIEYVVHRYQKQEQAKPKQKGNLSEFFGAMQIAGDPLEIQREMRDEWD